MKPSVMFVAMISSFNTYLGWIQTREDCQVVQTGCKTAIANTLIDLSIVACEAAVDNGAMKTM